MFKLAQIIVLLFACAGCVSNQAYRKIDDGLSLVELTIDRAQQAIKNREISCERLTQRYLARIKTYDQVSGINAITYVNSHALSRARQLDARYSKAKLMRRLHCVPVILKDNIGTHDMPTEAGSIALKGFHPVADADIVKKLRSEDAIIIAKGNMDEWAFSPDHTISSTHGETRNAYDVAYVPAGSSGGVASAIAANLGIIGVGTDTGNSVRGPASHLSLVGLRPTIGAVSNTGIVPLLSNRDIAGPMARTVMDTAIAFSIMADKENFSKTSFVENFIEHQRKDLKGIRLGVMRQLYERDTSDFEIIEIMEKAINDLKKSGAIIVDPFSVPNFEKLRKSTGFCARFYFDLKQYLVSQDNRAPIHSFDDVVRNHLYLENNQHDIDWVMEETGNPNRQIPPCVGVKDDLRRHSFLSAVISAMDKSNLDAIIYPTWSNPARKIDDTESPTGNNSSQIAPHTGQPAITVPMGFTEQGLPVGLQFLARPFDEKKLLEYGYVYEQNTMHRKPPDGYGAVKQLIINEPGM